MSFTNKKLKTSGLKHSGLLTDNHTVKPEVIITRPLSHHVGYCLEMWPQLIKEESRAHIKLGLPLNLSGQSGYVINYCRGVKQRRTLIKITERTVNDHRQGRDNTEASSMVNYWSTNAIQSCQRGIEAIINIDHSRHGAVSISCYA